MFVNNSEMFLRLVLATLIGGIIGYERELRGHDAGIRTHAIVSLGAAVMALIQLETSEWLIDFAIANPERQNMLSSDITRFIAQVVSGIGFLGAGTIIVSKRSVAGLTTAASLWSVAGLGIASGLGYYSLSLFGTVLMLIILRTVKSLFQMDRDRIIEINYVQDKEVNKYIKEIFKEKDIKVIAEDYSFSYLEDGSTSSKIVYELHIPKEVNLKKLLKAIGENKYIFTISTL